MTSPEEQMILICIPSLHNDKEYKVTSPNTRDYNCIAWALGRTDVWYWPYLGNKFHESDEYWPAGVPDNTSIDSFVQAMQTEGFFICANESLEEGFTKIALYKKNGECSHASRQYKDGTWTSKMGPLHDICHSTPHTIEGSFYGNIHCFMKRHD